MFVPFPLGRYTIVDRIRYGGMGEVLKAQKVEEQGGISTWAVKRPLPTVREDEELLGLFWKETELMQKLDNPAFPGVAEVGVSQGVPYLVMEYIPGASVAEMLSCRGQIDLHIESFVLMACDLATAAGKLHKFKRGARMLVHGDIRASNVMVDTTGRVRLLDLGLALANDALWRRVVRSWGKDLPPFLRDHDKSPEFDTWCIARLLVECLGGDELFQGRTRAPKGLIDILARAVDPTGMYVFKSARALKWELLSYLDRNKEQLMRDELARAAAALQKARDAAA